MLIRYFFLLYFGAVLHSSSPGMEAYTAAEKGDLKTVQTLVGADKTLLAKKHGSKSWTLLHAAVNRHQIPVIEYLVAQGANVNAPDKEGRTPLHLATLMRFPPTPPNNSSIPRVEVVGNEHRIKLAKYLIRNGANVNAVDSKNRSVLFHAVMNNPLPSFAELLIANSAKVDTASKPVSQTPLYIASYYGQVETVKALLKAGADVQIGEKTGFTPLAGASVAWKQHGGPDYAKVAASLIAAGAKVDSPRGVSSPLHFAASDGNVDVVKLLLAHKADVNAVDERGRTPLHHASEHEEEHVESARLLIAAGTDVNAKAAGENNVTPLMVACQLPSFEAVQLLLKHGADPDMRDDDQATALHYAVRDYDYDIVKTLIDVGAGVNVKDRRGETPLFVLADDSKIKRPKHAEILTYLITHGADPMIKNQDDELPADHLRKNNRPDLLKLLESTPVGQIVKKPQVPRKPPTPKAYRTWTSSDGKFTVEARLLDADKDTATLETKNKRIIKVPLKKLSASDRAIINRFRQ